MALFAANSAASFRSASLMVLHTLEVEHQVERLQDALQAYQIAFRGFLVTGVPEWPAGEAAAASAIAAELRELRRLTADNQGQQQRVAKLDRAVEAKLTEWQWYTAQRQVQGSSIGVEAVQVGASKMGSVMALLTEITREEESLLQKRQAVARRDGVASVVVLGSGLVFGGGLLVAVVRLVRQREAADELLNKNASEIHDLYNNAPCGYHSLDENGVVTGMNDTELRWLGYAREEVVGQMAFASLLTERSRRIYSEHFPRFKQEGKVSDLEFDLIRKDGSTFPVLLNAVAVYDQQGAYVSSRSVTYDHTERRRAELLLQGSRDFAKSVVDTVREPLLVLSETLAVADANRAYLTTFHTAGEEVAGHDLATLDGGAWNREDLLAELRRIVPEHVTMEGFEVVAKFPRLGQRTMLLNARKLYRPGNNTAQLLLAIEDITERKEAEQALQAVNAQLKRRTQELEAAHAEAEAFSYSVSHDLRAPLRHVSGFAQMLENHLGEKCDEKTRHYVSTISGSAEQMGVLIDELLTFSRIGRSDMKYASVSLALLVNDVIEALRLEVGGRQVAFEVGALPTVQADRALLKQVMLNLLGNAVKYTRNEDRAVVTIGTVGEVNGEVTVFVRDNGAGFDPRFAGKLFGVFQRLHSSADFEGNGVGLATVKRIVQRHGGRVWAEGRPGDGATFYFSLPASETPASTSAISIHV